MQETQGEPRMIANREVRHVPANWEHPRDERGRFVPLLPEQMPEPGSAAAIMAYETTSEGTPISPRFPDTPEGRLALVRHCVEHATTFGQHRGGLEAWAAVLFGEHTTIGLDCTVEA